MDLKKNIKKYGWTISSVAGEMGITQSALSQQINNSTITFAKVEQIASIIGVSLFELLSDESEATSGAALTCPHCGKRIGIKLEKEG